MKIFKKLIFVAVILIFALGLTACGDGEDSDAPYLGEFTIEEIQDDPTSFLGDVTLTGIVGESETRDFSLQNEQGTFEVLIDYLGSQALPSIGTEVTVEGTLTENRPCCGPGFTLSALRFDAVEE